MPRWRQVCTRPRSLVSGDRPTKSEFPRKVASSACNVRVDDVLFLPDPVPMMRSDRGAFSHSAINLRTNTVAAVADGDRAGRDLRLRVDHPPPTSTASVAAVTGFANPGMSCAFRAWAASPRAGSPRARSRRCQRASIAEPRGRCQPAPPVPRAMISQRAAFHRCRPRASRSSGNVSSQSCR